MNLARRIQPSKLCSLVEFAITNNSCRELHIATSGSILCRQISVNLTSAQPASSGYKLWCRSVVTLEQAQGQVTVVLLAALSVETKRLAPVALSKVWQNNSRIAFPD